MNDDVTLPLDDSQGQRSGPGEVPAARDVWRSFRLLARVGYGGFGEVYRAWDPNLEREVALKLLLPTGGDAEQSEEEYKAMLREARALASVRHPNIVSIYGIDRHDGRVGFWMDFVRGKTLSVLVGAQGPFGDREATLIGLDVARALAAVHRAGLLHRDIKAENVMREEGGRILLMDLGLSSLQHDQATSSGTPNYMAPEIWQGGQASVESDIYAMGVLLYFLVTGEHPMKLGGLTARDAMEAFAKRRPLMDLRSDLPEPFLRTVTKAMESDPAKRFSSAGQLAAALAECLGTAAPVEVAVPAAPVGVAEKRRRRLPALLSIAAAVILGLAAFRNATVRQWLHLAPAQVAAGVSANENDRYIKAQELLKKSYSDANVAEAVRIFQQILQENPKFALAQAGLGAAYFVQYRNNDDQAALSQAKDATNKALSMEDNLSPAYVTLAQIEADAGHTELAMQQAQKAIDLEPRSPEGYAAKAEVFQTQGKTQEAIDTVQKAIDLDPDNSMWLVRLGDYYLSNGRLQEAAGEWQAAVKLDPQNIFAYYDLGIAEMRMDRLDDARSNFQKVLQITPDAYTYRALGTVLLYQGRFDEAIAMGKKAIALNPNDQQAWANLGSDYEWMGGRRNDEIQAYRKAIELGEAQRAHTPDNANLLINLADYYATIGDEEKSLPLIRKALALSPSDPKILYFAGESYELLGQRAKAVPLLAEALARGFSDIEFQRNPELAALRADPGFASALKLAKQASPVDSSKKID